MRAKQPMKVRKNQRTHVRRNGKRSGRADVLRRSLEVAQLLDQPRTVAELATRTGIHWRTVYRIIADLGAAGWKVTKTKADASSGRAPALFVATRGQA